MPQPMSSREDRLEYERHLQRAGYRSIAGVDEVGRGALAGPLVAAAVILPDLLDLLADIEFWCCIRDSKTILPAKRSLLAAEIHSRARCVSIAFVASTMLDDIGVGPANRMAMELAVRGLDETPDFLLIDAMTLDYDVPQIGIIDGDAKSVSIAAASIVAKVARDTEMCALDLVYPAFGFASHKGYGVARHIAALHDHGPCEHHRFSFQPVRISVEFIHESS